ncbi:MULTISPECIES: SpvB/TcaC N-terminal domain-containing protein [Vibrio]|uniref:SpvB/TcaC N-terminal domain-containing protein n=1 Tax=Vibrio parahaemolyticus TaxID=670 RepID=A0AA47LA52_VIBPH|nr:MULTISPECIES: SpvB/TcaC N-terminal domain-containing protein [Vibrio]MBE3780062.1 virulence protein [Vibrio parahaemolyticus]MBE4231396.1 virulence protein [Vibrio parahaemolyticus]MCZ6249649.1 SpvB/TcaC N-terminal domain-containing protein [Vibrio parahaemolyticus]MCZ6279500.1 SpvB/TcaC N-terminal domain-containing protein [Vibrio parahaemolyticus]MCZ6417406.1 SpvB/TcaC N-terminal domain-containing protein [Vibrio parahaemolyticus]
MQNINNLKLETPTLPAGGGSIGGLKGDIAGAGPDGAATLSIPLPISAGRGFAPSLQLSYHSRAGNSPFGMGWNINVMSIRLRTNKGVPHYDGTDSFVGPDGEVLVPVMSGGTPEIRQASTLLGESLGESFTVHAYRSRTETDFSRLEYWVSSSSAATTFWVIYTSDGQVHLLGYQEQARINHSAVPSQSAVWLIESSVSATGEQIFWQYRAEDDTSCNPSEIATHSDSAAQRYPVAIWYGNKKAGRTLPAISASPIPSDWLFALVLDYGERGLDVNSEPSWLAPGEGNWLCRQDMFSSWELGFELRTRRLCRQVLMYHDVTALNGEENTGDGMTLVTRLLLEYNENLSVTTLASLRQVAYEPAGIMCALPPLTFDWQEFTPPTEATWQPRHDMSNLNALQPWQMVDLHGEGMAGILYQDSGAWWYRAPVRQTGGSQDAVTWECSSPLPSIPSLQSGGMLMDLDGDGYLEWGVTSPSMSGHYKRTPEREWQTFTPLSALPTEFAHPQTQLADITGSGLMDMVLIGPRSVRLYNGTSDGWQQAQTVAQSAGITLPIVNGDQQTLVAFSDMAGSGQQHLVEICADSVRYWPNLGHGGFGEPIEMSGFSQPGDSFNPAQLYLADIDGSGTTDLIYAQHDHLLIYLNQSGNQFAEAFRVSLPEGTQYDRTCTLQLADITGLGVASLIMTIPHLTVQHWVCHLSEAKPWLLKGMNNNMGANHTLTYRSSAQYWLDEKANCLAQALPTPACYLPFPLHTLQCTEITDEVTGNRLVSTASYRHGVWDGREKEFRGFGFVEVYDTDILTAQGSAAEISMPTITRSWYATGLSEVDKALVKEFWLGDSAAFNGYTPRFTSGSGDNEQTLTPDDSTLFWLNRGLKGMLLRSELYGDDNSNQVDVPYTVTEVRPQVRLIDASSDFPVVWPHEIEHRSYYYERVISDPQCTQQVLMSSDEYGRPLNQVNIHYPRRIQPTDSPYPDSLPETLFADSFDTQQQKLRLTQAQYSTHLLQDVSQGIWFHGLPNATREDAFEYPATKVPEDGLTLEALQSDSDLLADNAATFVGQQQTWYLDIDGNETNLLPAFPPLVAFNEGATLDKAMVDELSAYVDSNTLVQAGYTSSAYLFPRSTETELTLWTVRQGYPTYDDFEHFFLPSSYRDTLLTGGTTVTRDTYDCAVIKIQDAAGLTTTADYDWRFLTPVCTTDANDNQKVVTFDALGRVTSARFSGTENSQTVGYSDKAFTPPKTVDSALSLTAPLPVYLSMTYIPESWTWEGEEKLPPHVVTLTTDRYDTDAAQQVRQTAVFADGFGRTLQTTVRQVDGEALQRQDDGSLVTDEAGNPLLANTNFRWAVSGKTEYDNKGQAIRTFQPYFLDSWKYLRDDSARQDLYADTHYYDPLGRVWQVETAKGGLRRTLTTPWFVVSEDENDTAQG